MANEKKYYWLKLQKDFFKRHDIRIIESMPNGKDYILFYLKLLCESTGHEGNLRFSDTIPYSEQMLSTITNTNIDTVGKAIKIFHELHMIDLLDDGTYFMNEVNKMVGYETEWARKKREYRENQKQLEDNSRTIRGQCPKKEDNVRQEIEKELEKELEINIKEKNKEKKKTSFDEILDELQSEKLKEAFKDFIKMRKTIKAPLTDKALRLCISKLFKITQDENEMIEIINQSIENSWKSFYPLKTQDNNNYQKQNESKRAF